MGSRDREPAWSYVSTAPGSSPQTVRELFDLLDINKDGRISLAEVARVWPLPGSQGSLSPGPRGGLLNKDLADLLSRLAKGESGLDFEQFAVAVRLWHATQGRVPGLRDFLLRVAFSSSVATEILFGSMQITSLFCANFTQVGVENNAWLQFAAVGGVGALVAATLFDSHGVNPRLLLNRRAPVAVELSQKQTFFVFAAASMGAAAAPLVPLLASTVGDEKTKGMGPLAVMGLAALHLAGLSSSIVVLPEDKVEYLAPVVSSSAGAALSVGTALLVAYFADRPGSVRPLVAACAGLAIHSALTTYAALRAYRRGEIDCLEPVMAPLVQLAHIQQIMK